MRRSAAETMDTARIPRDPTLSPLRQAFAVISRLEQNLATAQRAAQEAIAVVGMGCRFPGGASNPELYWRALCDGVDAVCRIPEDRWSVEACYDSNRDAPGKIYTRFASLIGDVSGFDTEFFGMSPREARSLDPQQRLLLEVTWETLEHSAIPPATLRNSQTGVFVGIGQNDYAQFQLHAGELERITRFDGTGNGFCFAPGRISYTLGLHGPSVAVDCACSSSLVAVHLACQSLRARECDLALAAGVQLILSPEVTVFLCRAGALAPDGRCKAFDAAADGFGRGEGCGAVALKRLSTALADGDFVWAVIRGSAVNHDGPSSGLTVPSATAQTKLLGRALSAAGLKQEAVSYVEAHGTGTLLGDPIEIEALAAVYAQSRSRGNPLWVASAKTNHGHLEAAAGVAGLIKTVLSLHYKKLPPHLHLKNPNPHIPWNSLPFRVPTELVDWISDQPRIAGVSSFGFGGTNAHVLVEEAPTMPQAREQAERPNLLVLSARTLTAVQELAGRYATYWEQHPEIEVADVCQTAALGRNHFPFRTALIVDSRGSACIALRAVARGEMPRRTWRGHAPVGKQANGGSLLAHTLEDAANAYVNGLPIDWTNYFPNHTGPPVTLPTYPFQRQRYWIENPNCLHRKVRENVSDRSIADEGAFLYEIAWERSERERLSDILGPRRRWIVLCDDRGIGGVIAQGLRKRGQFCISARPGSKTAQKSEDEWSIALSDPDPFANILRQASDAEMGDGVAVVHCWSLDTEEVASTTNLGLARNKSCVSALRLFQALRQKKSGQPPRVWLVTQACQPAGDAMAQRGLPQAMLWGLGRSIALEWPDLWGGLHDLGVNPNGAEIERVVEELLNPTMDQVAWRGADAWIPSLRRRTPAKTTAPLVLRRDGAYWVTGGWGTLGLHLAKWLAGRGTGLIVLSARREPTAEARAFAEACASRGVQVWLRRSDCTNAEETFAVAREIETAGFPLRGVFHAAGVGGYDDSSKLDISDFDRVCRAKVEGAWNLHEATRYRDLDHFVLFSSIASVWGSKGQAHYSAANHFLDALACWRSGHRLPAISVNWGPWLGSRLVDPDAQRTLEHIGIYPLAAEPALRALETVMLGSDVPQAIAVYADWGRFTTLFDALPRRGFFNNVTKVSEQPNQSAAENAGPVLAKLSVPPDMPRREHLKRRLGEILAELLGYENGRFPNPQTGFFELGMDSVMAVELRHRVEQEVGVPLSATLAFDYPNLIRLVEHLEKTVFGSLTADQSKVQSETASERLTQREDKVAHEALDSLIEERLGQLETLLNLGGRIHADFRR